MPGGFFIAGLTGRQTLLNLGIPYPDTAERIALMKNSVFALVAILMISCGPDGPKILLKGELNTEGTRHRVWYNADVPVAIEFTMFEGTGTRDTTGTDMILRRELDSIIYNQDGSITMSRLDKKLNAFQPFRKFYFNRDGLLTALARFSPTGEYQTDTVHYDYTMRKAFYYDLVNKNVFELEFDNKDNISSILEKRISDQHLFRTTYFYHDASKDPFLVNVDDSDQIFGCFHKTTVGLFWNNASRPRFSSANNVQSFKEIKGEEESNGLFEYHYQAGLPMIQYGNNGVIYYEYLEYAPAD